MSDESTNVSSEKSPAKRLEPRIVLHLPDLTALPAAQPLPAVFSRSPQSRTRGMEVLQRVMSRRSGILAGLTGPNRWQNRLWLATFSLIGVSCLMLAIGMRQPAKEKQSVVTGDPVIHEEFENDLDPPDGSGAVRHVAAYHASGETAQAGITQSGVIQPVGFEAPTAGPPRGAWLEGTIIPDESDE
jgi:hypothetical protein